MDRLLKQLEQLKRLPGLKTPPGPAAHSLAARALAICWRHDVRPLKVIPSPGGGIVLPFWNGSMYGDLEIANSGRISLVFSIVSPSSDTVMLERVHVRTVDEAVMEAADRCGPDCVFNSSVIVGKKKLDTCGLSR